GNCGNLPNPLAWLMVGAYPAYDSIIRVYWHSCMPWFVSPISPPDPSSPPQSCILSWPTRWLALLPTIPSPHCATTSPSSEPTIPPKTSPFLEITAPCPAPTLFVPYSSTSLNAFMPHPPPACSAPFEVPRNSNPKNGPSWTAWTSASSTI